MYDKRQKPRLSAALFPSESKLEFIKKTNTYLREGFTHRQENSDCIHLRLRELLQKKSHYLKACTTTLARGTNLKHQQQYILQLRCLPGKELKTF